MNGLVLVAALALLVALLAACKSSDKDGGDGKTPAAETPAADETPSDGGDGDDGDGGGGLQDLERLASQAAGDFTGKITYGITTEAGGQTTEQEWTLAQRPPDSRFEIVSTEGGQETRTIVIQTADKSYVCTSAGGSESCFESDQTDQYTSLFDLIFAVPQSIAGGIGDVGLVDESEREIGGVNANCFSVDTAALGGGASELCFSDEGLLLFLRGESAGSSFTYEAKSVSTDVSDADFEPPYEIFEIPTG
jgi:hypothetical protein